MLRAAIKALELILSELEKFSSPQEKEDRLHSKFRGEEFEFTVEEDGEPKDLSIFIENIALQPNDNARVDFRLDGFENPTSFDDLNDDFNFIYTIIFCRGAGSAYELGQPLMGKIDIAGYSPYDVHINATISSYAQSEIIVAIDRLKLVVSHYHHDWFQLLKELREEYADQYDGDPEDVPMEAAIGLTDHLTGTNVMQAYGLLLNYLKYTSNEDYSTEPQIPDVIDY